jgi:hypothetical protein
MNDYCLTPNEQEQSMGQSMCMQFKITHSDHIGGVIVIVFASSTVDRVFEPRSGQTKVYKIGICCFSDVGLRSKSK